MWRPSHQRWRAVMRARWRWWYGMHRERCLFEMWASGAPNVRSQSEEAREDQDQPSQLPGSHVGHRCDNGARAWLRGREGSSEGAREGVRLCVCAYVCDYDLRGGRWLAAGAGW